MSVNLGNTTPTVYSIRPTQSQIVKASDGTLVLVANVSNDLVYKTSDDDGATWDSSWTNIHTTSSYINDFDVYIDGSDDIHIAFFGLVSNQRIYYQKLSYGEGSWSVDSPVLVQAGSSTPSVKFAVRSNGDFWIASTGTLYYSTDSGSSWNSSTNPGTSENIVSIIPHSTNMWLITQRSGGLYYYEYTSSWGSSQTIVSSGITNHAYSMGVVKISDSNIWVTGRTSSGIKVFQYTSSWDSGTLLSDNTNDSRPCLSNVDSNPVCVWKDYDGSQYDIAYRIYNGSSWDSQVDVTDDATEEKWPTVQNNDTGNLYFTYLDNGSSPYAIIFDMVVISGDQTVTLNENITISETIDVYPTEIRVTLNENITVAEDVDTVSNIVELNENVTISENITVDTNAFELNEEITISEDITVNAIAPVLYGSKIISYNPLLIVTDTSPAKIAKVDITDPENPTWVVYTITGVSNVNNISYNSVNGYVYVVADSGLVAKIDITNLSVQTLIDTTDLNNLELSSVISTELKTFAGTDDTDGEIILIDEADVKSINLDIRYLQLVSTQILLQINTVLAEAISSDIRYSAITTKSIGLDIRFLKYDYDDISQNPISKADIVIKINDIDITALEDVDMDSVTIEHYSDNQSTVNLILHRQHDNLDYTNTGVVSEITNQNNVKIYINGVLEFDGKISNIDVQSENEQVALIAKMETPADIRQNINIPLPFVNEQLHLYHCFVDNVGMENPYIDSDAYDLSYIYGHGTDPDIDDTLDLLPPEYYKGIKIDLGTSITQSVSRWRFLIDVASQIINGTFTPKQNWTYFWLASITYLFTGDISGSTSTTVSSRYIGPSLGSIGSDVIELDSAYYLYQRQYDDIESSLGKYYIGEAPYLEISATNGVLTTKDRWEDKADGLYTVKDESYNNTSYCKKVAELEYEKLQNINGDVLPVTSATVQLSLDGYYYYGIKLLSRINLTNTTTAGIYDKLNGFPIGVKSIQISLSDMKVTLSCDNQKSEKELKEIDDDYPTASTIPLRESKIYSKYDINSRGYVA